MLAFESPQSVREEGAGGETSSAADALPAWRPVCKFWKRSKGRCKFGETCSFSHPGMAAVGQNETAEVGQKEAGDFLGAADLGTRAQDNDASVQLCTAWINTGLCPRMSECKFRHGTCGVPIGKARALWIAERRQRRAALPSTIGDTIPSQDKLGYRARAAVMAKWMVETFEVQDLEKGVLDVAGGRGDLSFELSLAHSLRCTVVDPRPVRLNKFQHRRISQALASLARSDGNENTIEDAVTTGHRAEDLAEAAQRMQKILSMAKELRSEGRKEEAVALLRSYSARSMGSGDFAVAGSGTSDGGPGQAAEAPDLEEGGEEAESLFFESDAQEDRSGSRGSFEQCAGGLKGPGGGGNRSLEQALCVCKVSPEICKCAGFIMSQRQEWFGERFAVGGDLEHVVEEAGVLCGLHPDEATDHIVRIALEQKKPFCIVPCCVMRTRVPRMGPDGKAVSSYEDYVAWLKAQHPQIQQGFLPFVGKNLVLYKTSLD